MVFYTLEILRPYQPLRTTRKAAPLIAIISFNIGRYVGRREELELSTANQTEMGVFA
jgi:hypothetical protein